MPGMSKDSFKYLYKHENSSFWFKARNNLIIWLISKYKNNFTRLMEVGCGTGFVLNGILSHFGNGDKAYYGTDLHDEGLVFAKERLPKDVTLFTVNLEDEGLSESFDIIAAFDVLEHIENDVTAIKNISEALTKDGLLMVTVPQHKELWSFTDEYAMHCRRYEADELIKKIQSANLEIVYSNSFVSLLYPAMYFSRKSSKKASVELEINPIINFVFSLIMSFELLLIKIGVKFKRGGSLVVVAKKAANSK